MTPQAKALRAAVAAAVGPGKVDAALRAVVEECEVTEDMVDDLIDATGYFDFGDRRDSIHAGAMALHALLEASGADR